MRVIASDHQIEEAFELPSRRDDPRLRLREADMQAAIIELAQRLGWKVYHTHDSRRSAKGFPDLVLVHAAKKRTIYAELKATKGVVTPEQDDWLQALADAGNHVHIWRPHNWLTGDIERELRGKRI